MICCTCPVGRLSCVTTTLTLDITRKLFNQFLSYVHMLIGTIDSYHFRLISLILILPGGHKVRTKQYLLASFPPTLHLTGMKFAVVMKCISF